MFDSFLQDIRIGLRVLAKEKGFCALAVFVLAVGIGFVTTQFAVVDGVLLRGFSFPDSDRLVDVQMVDPKGFTPNNFNSTMTTSDFADLRDNLTSFEGFTAYLNGSTVNMTYNGQPKRLTGGYVSHDFFTNLGVQPVIGRNFRPEEDQPGVEKAVLLSDALWRSEFGARPDIVGQAVRVNGRAGVIVGVMPPKFNFPTNEQLWIPVSTEFPVRARNDRYVNGVSVLAKLKPGVSFEQAESEVSALARKFAEQYPDTNAPYTKGYVRPLLKSFTGANLTGMLYTMLSFCVGVLLIACVNVMNMQFARATLRAKELSIRSALGATRIRLIRQMLTESFILSLIGAVMGIAIAAWGTDFLTAYTQNSSNPPPSWMTFELSPKVLSLVIGLTLLATLFSGFVPAWLASRTSSIEVLKEGGRGNTSRSVLILTRSLVIFQIVVTCVLLIGAMLQVQSIIRQQEIDYGYDTGAVLTARMGLMEGSYPDSASRKPFYDQLLREMRATPPFESVALTNRFRMVFSGDTRIEIEGVSYASDDDRTEAQFENISPGFFKTLGVKLLEGRSFTDEDSDQREVVAIVNATFARRHFGNGSALGRRFRSNSNNGTNPGPWRQIIGVVSDVRMQDPFDTRSDGSGFYTPFYGTVFGAVADEPQAPQFATAIVKPRGGQRPEALAGALQAVVNKVDPNLPLYFVTTPKVALDAFMSQNRLAAGMFAVFGGVAVLLAAVGLYGVMSFSVNQRTQEFGVRMALGADAARIMRMVLRQGAWQLGIGLTLGLGFSLVVAILARDGISQVTPQISPSDPATYTAVGLLLAVVALVATLVPALRATRVDPMIALRAE